MQVSPVFFSTDTETGEIRRGLGFIPEGRPLLFVGNHQVRGFWGGVDGAIRAESEGGCNPGTG